MHNINRLVKGKDRCTLLINEKDAEKLNIKHSQKVKVTSNIGSVIISVEISNEMMQGVVSIPHGWGHHYKNTQMEIAQQNAGVSINDLTDPNNLDKLTGNANFSGTRVKVERLN